jgi:hypothetical protein
MIRRARVVSPVIRTMLRSAPMTARESDGNNPSLCVRLCGLLRFARNDDLDRRV